MTTIAIVGAGTGLGAAIADRFGTEGFGVALISRLQKKHDQLAEELNAEGFRAALAWMLHEALGAENIHVGELIIPGAIEPGHPQNDPGALARRLWEHHTRRDTFREDAQPFPTSN